MKKYAVVAVALGLLGWAALAEVLNYEMPISESRGPTQEESAAFAQALDARLVGKVVTVDGVKLPVPLLAELYASQQKQPLWTNANGTLNGRGKTLIGALRGAEQHGLSPERYHLALIEERVKDKTPEPLAIDLLLTQALYHYVEDMLGGATPKRRIPKELKERWPHRDPIAKTQEVIRCQPIASCLDALPPSHSRYVSLQQKLSEYRALATAGGWPKFPAGEKMEPGKADARVPALRQILATLGDGPQALLQLSNDVYDPQTVEAFKTFQRRHGLNPDGVIGKQGAAALAVPVEKRIEAIEASLAEWRRLPPDLGDKYLLVNLPAYELHGFQDGKEAIGMRIVVGQAEEKWRTPLFSNVVKWVIFNPHWTVPKSIAREEMIYKIKEDPEFFNGSGYKLIKRDEETEESVEVDPATVVWDQVTPETFDYTIRQESGAGNVLGKVKFQLPDNQNIYLHDTVAKKFFARDYRALSHGCIRVSVPMALTYFLMDGNEGWSKARIDRAHASDEQRYIPITPVPAHTVYMAAWIDGNGTLRFADDIYGINKDLRQ